MDCRTPDEKKGRDAFIYIFLKKASDKIKQG